MSEKTITAEEKAAAKEDQANREQSFIEKIKGNLDLSADVKNVVEEELEKEKTSEEAGQKEESSEEGDAESQEETGGEAETSEEESTEETSPEKKRDKAQERINELTRQNKQKDAELKRLRDADGKKSEQEASDPDQKTLNRLSEQPNALERLNELKDDVLLAFKKEQDPKKEKELLELTKKIDRTIANVPQVFQNRQIVNFREAMNQTAQDFADSGRKFDEKAVNEIADSAKAIYKRSSLYQGSVEGQAEAWNLAVERYVSDTRLSADKSKSLELERKNNELKKKTSLDIATRKGSADKNEGKSLLKKARNGTQSDKTAAVKKLMNTDSLIPEQFRR